MAIIVVQAEVNSTVEKVWEVISDIDNEPRFWKGTKEVKTLSKEGECHQKRDYNSIQRSKMPTRNSIKT